jgi:hypothetical protein
MTARHQCPRHSPCEVNVILAALMDGTTSQQFCKLTLEQMTHDVYVISGFLWRILTHYSPGILNQKKVIKMSARHRLPLRSSIIA